MKKHKRTMRHLTALFAALVMCLGLLSAADAEMSYDGVIVAAENLPVTAAFGAAVEKVYVREGDLVEQGQDLVLLRSTPVFAPCDGTVSAVFAHEGDTLESVKTRYGGVVYIEPTNRYTVSASTEKAYSTSETKMIHIGETVYLSCAQDGSHTGPALVSAIGDVDESGNTAYTLEVTGGDFYIGETVDIYRDSGLSARSRLGRGTVKQQKPVAVDGTGSALKIHVRPGDTVQRGQLLFETVDGVLDGLYASSLLIKSPESGIVAKVEAANGGTVAKDGALVTLYPLSALQADVTVPVTDIGAFEQGQKLVLELDIGREELLRYEGVVESMSYIVTGEGRNMAVTAHVSFQADEAIRVGMPVVVYPVRDAQSAVEEEVSEAAPQEELEEVPEGPAGSDE